MWWFILVVFILFIGLSIAGFALSLKSLSEANEKTNAVIVDIDVLKTNYGNIYIPILNFSINGKEYTCKANSGIEKSIEIGDTLEILYRKDNPEDFYIASVIEEKRKSGIGTIIFFIIFFLMLLPVFIIPLLKQ